MACSSVRVRPQFPDTVLDTVPHSGDINEMEEVGNITWSQGHPAFHLHTTLSQFPTWGVLCALSNRSWLPGLPLSEKVDLLCHAGFWGSALPEW